jgi:hypothetical protein
LRDPIQGIVEEVRRIADATARSVVGVTTGTVLSRNPDGSIVVDDGSGGCARVANISNQQTQCGSQVILGVEPAIGQQLTICPVSVTITSSTVPCPIDDRTDENEEEEEEVVGPMLFSDDDGNLYDENGEPTGDTGSPAARDVSYDYSEGIFVGDGVDWFAGPSTNYLSVQIGRADTTPDNSGYQGIQQGQTTGNHNVGNSRLVQGAGTSSGLLFGLELLNTSDGGHEPTWTLVLRNSTTLAVVDTDTATWLPTWFNSRPDSYLTVDEDWEYGNSLHVFADQVDDSFWLYAKAGVNGELAGLFNISPADLSLLSTIDVDAVDGQFTKRMKRIS